MLIVAALGGNALLRRGEPPEAEAQRRNVARAAEALAPLAAKHRLVITHGNGPQIGLLAEQAAGPDGKAGTPLDVLGAETEGMIGYLIEQELGNRLPGRDLATLLTRTKVARDDPAFARPSKPIGRLYGEAEGHALAAGRGWDLVREPGGFRRIVASPRPRAIPALASIRLLLDAGMVVICAGGGGVPVAAEADGRLVGVEAVVDKDLASGLLADSLEADFLLLLTDVDAVYADWPAPLQRPLGRIAPAALRTRVFDAGSMAPKVEAACAFVEAREAGEGRDRRAAIGALGDAGRLLDGSTGTQVSI